MRKIPEPMRSRKVLVGGCFDLLHLGHIRFLNAAKKQGDSLIVALESDDFIRIKKKREPVHPQIERAEIVSALACVDTVILLPLLQSNKDYLLLVQAICPAVIAVTDNDPYFAQKEKQAFVVGARLAVVIKKISLYSTTNAIRQIKQVSGDR